MFFIWRTKKGRPSTISFTQHNIAGSLQDALPYHHPLARMFQERPGQPRQVRSVYGRNALFDLQKQRIVIGVANK